ncbi:MAG TPA: N-formylglutamate amidohydrolase [Fibrobacteria bacterium]|nr:N-formylglutamate amidohydrolase [Fibrobacteria bacterium]
MLPILVSTPHSSGHVPYWMLARMLQTGESESGLRRRLFKEGDPFTDALFNIPEAEITINAPASRFVADLNRDRNESGENGVIKLTDFERRAFYPTGYVLSPKEREMRLSLYYDPYHAALEKAFLDGRDQGGGRIRFFLDGHSMTAQGPAIGPDQGKPRPALCIGNFGDRDGDPVSGPVSCAPPLARGIRDRLAQLLKDPIAASGLPQGSALNQPFDGGHILRKYSLPPYSVPGVMIEVNRALYLDEATLEPIPGRVEAISKAMAKLAAWIAENLP